MFLPGNTSACAGPFGPPRVSTTDGWRKVETSKTHYWLLPRVHFVRYSHDDAHIILHPTGGNSRTGGQRENRNLSEYLYVKVNYHSVENGQTKHLTFNQGRR